MKEEIQKTKERVYIDATHLSRNLKQCTGEKNDFYVTLRQLENILEIACPNDCVYEQPYGLVAEEGCPVHDEITPREIK